eukprot:TRINITY_DN97869_c0_g1_i1.p1 TRINITY_DN97869_c0_g1~~TRINITY_DN97869_c0_g1_i1.p1  ORF type:complete len:235 (+),score=15.71 TRINITY_DN97869_c0_g1_i1:53-757(+)
MELVLLCGRAGLQRLMIVAAFTRFAASSSVYVAQLCRGGMCNDPAFPILDYDENEQKCICRAHPCWNDNGIAHACPTDEFPFLHFSYDQNKNLACSCSRKPQYDSLHIAKSKCPGEFCDSMEYSILDWSPEEQKCFCRNHPCLGEESLLHECKDPKFPILHFSLDLDGDAGDRPVCRCISKLESPPSRSLRGFGEPPPQICTYPSHRRRQDKSGMNLQNKTNGTNSSDLGLLVD